MTDKLTEFLLNGLATDVVVISTFIVLVGVAYAIFSKAIKKDEEV